GITKVVSADPTRSVVQRVSCFSERRCLNGHGGSLGSIGSEARERGRGRGVSPTGSSIGTGGASDHRLVRASIWAVQLRNLRRVSERHRQAGASHGAGRDGSHGTGRGSVVFASRHRKR